MTRIPPTLTGGRQLLRAMLAFGMLCGIVCSLPSHAVDPYSEAAVKAAFIYRFTAYVEWPEESSRSGKFTIAVLGDNDVAENLRHIAAGRARLNHPVVVRRISSIHDAREAQVLYVGNDRRADLRSLLDAVAGHGVLVVTDAHGGLQAGSAVNFLKADDRLRFEVSLPAAQRAKLKVSAELLSVAARVEK